jgi:hypothetical protein
MDRIVLDTDVGRRPRSLAGQGADPSSRPPGGQGPGHDHRRCAARGRPRRLNDTWTAACCIEGGLPLLTLNRRDFADFAQHDGLVLLGA